MTYAINTPAQISRVYVYSLEQDKSFPVTDGLTEATEPVFDAGGKYLYFLASNDTGMSKHGFSQSAADSRPPRWSLNLAVLDKDLPSPFLRESDEEKGEPERPMAKGGDGAKKDEGHAVRDRLRRARPAHPVVPAAERELRRPDGRARRARSSTWPARSRARAAAVRAAEAAGSAGRRSTATTSTGGATRPSRPA